MKVIFDDWVEGYDGSDRWTCICPACKAKYKIPDRYLDDCCGEEICGVKGCENMAEYYIDFPSGTTNLEFEYEEG